MLYVVPRAPTLTQEALSKYSSENLTGYKKPKHIRFVKDLPKTNVGKELRRELRDAAVKEFKD